MRALVLLALAAAAADVTVGTSDEPTPVKTADKLRAALAKGDPVIELWDDILLDGAPAVATHDTVIEGNNYMIYQTTGARHFVSNGTRLELKNVQLKTGGHPSPAPTCAPTPSDETKAPTSPREAPLTLRSIEDAGLTCGELEKTENGIVVSNFHAKSGGGVIAIPCWPNVTRVYYPDGTSLDLPLAEMLFVQKEGWVLAYEKGWLHVVSRDGVHYTYKWDRQDRPIPVTDPMNKNYMVAGRNLDGEIIVVEMIHPGATLYMYRSRGEELVKVQTLDLSTRVGNIKALWVDIRGGPRLYIRGVMRDNVDTETGRWKPRYAARIDIAAGEMRVKWISPIMTSNGGPTLYPRSTDVVAVCGPFFARLDSETGEVLELHERGDAWQGLERGDEPDGARGDEIEFGSAHDGQSDFFYTWSSVRESKFTARSSTPARWRGGARSSPLDREMIAPDAPVGPHRWSWEGETLLQRHRVSDGKVEWTVDHGLAFFDGMPIRKAVVVAGDPLRVVLSVNSSIYIATFDGERPYGEGVPTQQPTKCLTDVTEFDRVGCVSLHHGEFVGEDVVFDGCSTNGDGGAIFAEDTRVTLRRCTFDNCASGSLGGAVCLQRGELRVEHSRFSGAKAGLNGGAIHAVDAPVTVLHSSFQDAEAARDGGALEVDGPSLIVRDSNFTSCKATGRKQVGGAIRAFASSEITSCMFEGCSAGRDGAAFFLEGRSRGMSAVVSDCYFTRSRGRDVVKASSYASFVFRNNVLTQNNAPDMTRALMTLDRISKVELLSSKFEDNAIQVLRAYQLYRGSTVIDNCHFKNNRWDFGTKEEGLVFLKESPEHLARISSSVFVNNSGAFGGALHFRLDAEVVGCRFEGNRARQGGAISIGSTSSIMVADSSFVSNKADVGGAVEACATSEGAGADTCAGSYTFYDIQAYDNEAVTSDGDRSGGGAFKINGGRPTTLRDVQLAGNLADGKPSSLGFRLATANLHKVTAEGPVFLAMNGKVNSYCSPSLEFDVSETRGNDEWLITPHDAECSLCLPGTEFVENECVACAAGRYKGEGDLSCRKCSGKRKYQSSEGSTTCDKCKKGKHANSNKTHCRDDVPKWVFPFLVAVAVGLVALSLLWLLWRARRDAKKRRALQAERQLLVQEKVVQAMARVREFQAHFCTLSGDKFAALDALTLHEDLRDSMDLDVYDSIKDVQAAMRCGLTFVFLSHQWLAFDEPDPGGVHFASMKIAVNNVAKDTGKPLEKIRIWLDVMSIPQKNRSEQRLAIAALPMFASACNYFVVVAPTTRHADTHETCDSRTYRKRAWCRAEIMSCWARNGTMSMYVSTNQGLRSLATNDSVLLEALDVFDGDLTCCHHKHNRGDVCDKEALMLPMLGLYADLYKERKGMASEAYSVIEPIKDRLYPKTFKYVHLVDGKERTVESPLFGDLIEAVELSVRLGEVDENDPLWKRPMPDFAPGTNAQRRAHKLRARGEVKSSGSGREVQLRRSFSTVFSSDLNSQGTPPRMPPRPSRSLEAEATQATRGRPMLSRSMTWRASAPRLPHLEDEGDGVA